jgi:multiple sugar transport system ATP-binding protein
LCSQTRQSRYYGPRSSQGGNRLARILFEGVNKRFGSVTALYDLTLEIHDREFFVLLGPSGCGKTTALRIVAGLEEPSGGSVYIGDRVVNDVPPKDRDLAMVFQNYALYPHMSVYQNLAFGLRMRKYARPEIDRLVRDVAGTLGIADLLGRKPAEISGGQRQRVALGRAIVRQPRAFLMDEPLSNLDAKMRVQMRAELIRLHRELGTTFVYVTHDQVEAMTMGARIAVMESGRLQQVGPPQEVYDRPANLFVAEFIGSPAMNFLEAEPADDGTLKTADASIALTDAQASALRANTGDVVVGIRPEHLVPLEGEGRSFAATFTGKVDLVESLGSELHVIVTLEHRTVVVRVPAPLRVAAGAQLRLGVAAQHLHLFDKSTGRRIGT